MKNWHTPPSPPHQLKALTVLPFLPQTVELHLSPGLIAHRTPNWKPLEMSTKTCSHLCQIHLWCAQPELLILRPSPLLAAAGSQRKVRGPGEQEVLVPDPLQVSQTKVSRSRRVSAGAFFEIPGLPTFSAPPSQARLGSTPAPGDHSSPANPHAGDEIFITYILAPPAAFRESK